MGIGDYQVTTTESVAADELSIPLAVGRNARLVVALRGDIQPGDIRRAISMLDDVPGYWLALLAREEKP
jgi:hypothetical protein